MNIVDVKTTARNASLGEIRDILQRQADVRYDVVVSADKLEFRDGLLVVKGGAARVVDDPDAGIGVAEADAVLAPTRIFDDGIADRLGIPAKYLRLLRTTGQPVTVRAENLLPTDDAEFDVALLDVNVNGWLQQAAREGRKFLVRGFRTDDPDEVGVARAFLSDRYGLGRDNLDMIVAALSGIHAAGIDPSSLNISGDLSERSMRVKINAPQITAAAPVWLGNYRSPFNDRSVNDDLNRWRNVAAREGMGYEPGTEPIVEAYMVLGNSETGGGAWTLTPGVMVRVCRNGLTVKADAMRSVHLGSRLDEGIVRPGDDTVRKELEVITLQARDAVKAFLNVDYVTKVVTDIERRAGAPVTDAVGTIERIGKVQGFTEGEQASILDLFIRSGDLTAGGVLNAVTAAAQVVDDPDRAADLEDAALDVLALAADQVVG